jgi:outer membrane protein, heavy metal efflux system
MVTNLLLRAATAALLLAVGACASVPPDRGRSQVQKLASERMPGVPAMQDTAQWRELLQQPLSVDDAIRIALQLNPALRAQYAQLGIAAADVFDATRLANPALSLAILFPQGSALGRKSAAGATLGFSELLLRGSRSRSASLEFQRTRQQVAASVFELAVDVQRAWFDCVAAGERAAIRQHIEAAAQANAELMKAYGEAGNSDALSLQLQAVAATEAHIESQRAASALILARARLQALLGVSAADSGWKVPTVLPEPATNEPSFARLQSLAPTQRLDLLAARSHVAALEQQMTSAHRYRFLSAGAGSMAIGVNSEREADGSRRLGPALSLSLPVFNQGQGTVSRADALLEVARAQQQQLELQAGNDLQVQDQRLRVARERYQSFREQLIPQREAVVEQLQRRVNFMLAGAFELLLARQQELQAREGAIEALREYWETRLELMRASGASFEGVQS